MPDVPLNASEILAYLNEVAGALPPTGPRHTIVVVGGSLLALHGLRQSTLDVDTLARIEAELADAVAAVARVHDLAPAWLNDASAPFRPQTFVQADCDVLLDRPRLGAAVKGPVSGLPRYVLGMARPPAAYLLEDAFHRRTNALMRGRGWGTRTIGHTGYGSQDFVRVLGRVLLSRRTKGPAVSEADGNLSDLRDNAGEQRGWRAFVTAGAMHVPVRVIVGDRTTHTLSDRSGYIDVVIPEPGLQPGWHAVTIEAEGGKPVQAAVLIIDREATFGLVSDIDDTVISTSLPRPMIAAWNTFVRQETARHLVPGMAPLLRTLIAEHPGAPTFYLSTGAWNTAPTLTRFLKRHGYPAGPMLMTDWGPTNTGWFRSGQEHKTENLHRLAREFPRIRWILIGDDGQHDPKLYGDFARDRPDVVEAIAIRELSPAEQVLSHGIPVSIEEFAPKVRRDVPVCRAPDGYSLLRQLKAVLG